MRCWNEMNCHVFIIFLVYEICQGRRELLLDFLKDTDVYFRYRVTSMFELLVFLTTTFGEPENAKTACIVNVLSNESEGPH